MLEIGRLIDMDRGHGIRCECALCQPYMVENERDQLLKENTALQSDRARLLEALKETTKLLDTSSYHHLQQSNKNDALIAEMEGK